MPTKILTDQPEQKEISYDVPLLGASYAVVVEPPFFSVSESPGIGETADPADANRTLRAGQVFFITPMMVCNTTGTDRTISVKIVRENGDEVFIARTLTVGRNDTVAIPINGLSLFKRDLASPASDGDQLQAVADSGSALSITGAAIETEALNHAPNGGS